METSGFMLGCREALANHGLLARSGLQGARSVGTRPRPGAHVLAEMFRNTTSQLQRRLSCCLRGPLQRMRRPLLSGLHPATSLRSRLQSEAPVSPT